MLGHTSRLSRPLRPKLCVFSFYRPSRLLISTPLPKKKNQLAVLSCRRIQIAKAKETEAKIDVELEDLQATLSNIQDARPFEDLTVRFPLPPSAFLF